MEKYIVDGQGYNVAPQDLQMFLEKFPNAIKYDEPGKTIDPASSGMDSGSENGSSEQSEISAWQSFKNNISNAFEMVSDVGEFYGIGTGDKSVEEVAKENGLGAYSGLNIATTLIYESVFGKDKMKEITKENPVFFKNLYASDSKQFQNIIENFEKEKKDQKRTMTFKEADSFGDYLSVIGGSIANVGGSVAYNLGTFGTGFFMDFAADNFITANKEKAKANNITLEDLMKSGEQDVAAPFRIAAFQAGLEYFGFSKIVGKTGVGKQFNKKVGEYLTKNYKKSKNIRNGLNILGTGRVEAFTEMGQTGLEIYNKELAVAKGKGEDINDLMSIAKGMFSEQGIEAGLQGFFGGTGLKGGAYSAKALTSIRKYDNNLDVEEDLSKLVELRKRYNSSKDEDVKFALDKEIKKAESNVKDKIKKGNDIYNSLSDNDIKKIEELSDLSDVTAFRANNLIEKFRNNEIKEDDFNVAIEGLSNQYKENKANIQEILYKENIEFAKKEGEKIGKEVVEIEELDDFQKTYNDVRTKGDFEGDVTDRDGFIKGDQIYINKKTALKEGAINVGSHELLHGIIGKSFDKLNTDDKKKLGKSFISFLNKEQEAAVRKRLKESYNLEGDSIFETEEIFTAFSDAIAKKEITFNETVFQKIGLAIQELMNKLIPGYRKEFKNGRQAYDFLKEYQANIKEGKLGKRAIAFAEQDKDVDLAKFKAKASKTITDAVDKLGKVDKDGNNLTEKGTGNFYYQAEADDVVKEIKEKGYLDNLIAARYKADKVPKNFVSDVITALTPDIKSFKPEENNSLFGYLQGRITFRAGDVYNKIYKQKEEDKGSRDVGETTKEGDVKIQVAAETTSEMKKLEEKDMSIQAQIQEKADKQKAKQQAESKFRKILGLETGGVLYMKVLDAARKSLLRAYSTKDTVRQIQRNLRDQANTYLFKDVKNLLGTNKYEANLKQYREIIMESLFVSDLVQMERETSQDDRVFTKFVKKLTTKQEVEDAVNQNLLPPSAINAYNKDKSVNLYQKGNPTEKQFLSYFMIPAINPVTGLRSGKKGTRKDTLAKNMAGALTYDATMEVAQEPEIIEKRQQLAEIKNETIDVSDIQRLAAAINRKPNVKFSLSSEQVTENLQSKIEELINNANQDPFYFNKIITVDRDDTGKATGYKLNIPLERDSSMPGPREHSKQNKEAIAKIVYKYITNNEYGSIVNDKKLQSEILREIILDNKNGKTTNAGIAHENIIKKQLQKTVSFIKNSMLQVVGGGKLGDIYVSLGNIKVGIETKLQKARGISQSLTFLNESLDINFPNKNTTTNDKGSLFDDIIGKQAQDQYKKLQKALRVAKLGEIKNFTLNEAQASWLKDNGRSNFLIEIEVPVEYLSTGYASGKYKNAPQGFIVIGRNLYRMATGNKNVDNTTQAIVNESRLNIKDLELNKGKKIKLVGEFMSNIGVNKKVNFRISGRINSTDYVDSNVDITNEQTNKKLINAIEKTLNKQSTVKLSKSAVFSRSTNNPTKGITVLDFDDTLATTKSLVKFTRPDGTTGTLNAEQYASTYENLLDQGYTFDFSEFNKVVKGKLAPLFQKALKLQSKFGPKNMFVLTARPPAAQKAIFDFLKANGLNIPIDNITGLGNSTAEAKALWIAEKVGEGFNDFYFADDALQNVQAVKNMLDQLDVKSKVQQARVKFSNSMNDQFNDILEDVTGIEAQKRFSAIKGRKRGDDKGKFRFFIPPSHEDFVGLLYNFMGKGRKGDAHRDFLEQALVRPLNRAYRELDTAKQAIANDYKKLNEQFPDVNDKLIKTTPDGDFTFQDAIRVYLWNKHGHKIPGLTETDQAKLTKLVESDSRLQAYAETLNVISKQEDYVAPGESWETANIRIDLVDATGRVGRAQYLSEFIENADVLFSEENLNKIEAAYGKDFREALEDMLHRIKTGVNRPKGQSGKPNRFLNWLNASVAGVMFFNTRSALLQQLSNVNYLNFADNNILAAGKAFANQKQYWKDFAFILNSDMLKQRRGGIGTDVNGAELVEAIKKARPDSLFDQVAIITGKLLRLGFLPTQIGDSIAIATGGAAFYRNRINTYLKQGLSQKEAEAKAFTDFQDITQSTQQSARPDMTSKQQASWIGKLVLNFLNTPSQYNRIIKKAGSDLKNRRITRPNTTQTQSDMSNLSRILYYGAAQNLIFYGLQTALFAVMFGDDDDESEAFLKKKERVINGSIDTILRGSGIYGVALSTLKNMMIKFAEQREKSYNKDESAVIMEALNFSPVIGIRARKIVNAEKTLNYNTKVIDEMTTLDIDNPQWSAVTNYIEATTTLPTNRLYQKTINVRNALDNQYTAFQRAMFFSGYTTWSLDLGDTEKMKKIKEKVKSKKKSKSKFKGIKPKFKTE